MRVFDAVSPMSRRLPGLDVIQSRINARIKLNVELRFKMSIEVGDRVWKRSSQRGAGLLVLLAIADFANHDGSAYPSIRVLSRKARLSERHLSR